MTDVPPQLGADDPLEITDLSDGFFTTERRMAFVKYVDEHSQANGTAEAVKQFGAGSERLFFIWKGLVEYSAAAERAKSEYSVRKSKLESILHSGVLYMLVGVAAMIVGALIYNKLPDPFIFVAMVLGIAVFLYGTGTNAAGDVARSSSGAEAIKANVRIAGGAGVMALVVGAGLIFGGEHMQTTFAERTQYSKAVISIAGGVRGDTLLFVQGNFQDRHLSRFHDGKIEVIFEHEVGEMPPNGCYVFHLQDGRAIIPISVNLRFDEDTPLQKCREDAATVSPVQSRGIYRMEVEQREIQGNDNGVRYDEAGRELLFDLGLDASNDLK